MKTDLFRLRHALGTAAAQDYVDWAEERLCAGDDSPDLRVLAGLVGRAEEDDIPRYFRGACRELNLEVVEPDSAPRSIAQLVIEVYEAELIPPEEALAWLAKLYVFSDYSDPLLDPFFTAEEELFLLRSGDLGDHGIPCDAAEQERILREEIVLFREALELELPPAFAKFLRCGSCGFIGEMQVPRTQRSLLPWRSTPPNFGPVCPECGAKRLQRLSDPAVRREFYKSLREDQAADEK